MVNNYHVSLPIIKDDMFLEDIRTASVTKGNVFPLPPYNCGYFIVILNSGSAVFTIDGRSFHFSQYQSVLFQIREATFITANEDCDYQYICLSGYLTHKMLSDTIDHGGHLLTSKHYSIQTDFNNIENFCELNKTEYTNQILVTVFDLLLKVYNQTQPLESVGYPPLVENSIVIIHEEFAYLYGIDELAQRLYVTKNHLIRVFTASVGISPGKYLTKVRIEQAKLFLQSNETSLEVVSASCGFSGANYFCKVFKRETGMSPGTFLKTAPKIHSVPKTHDELYL